MCTTMLSEVLRALECLTTLLARKRLHRNVYPNVACDVIAFAIARSTTSPVACETEVVSAVPSNMFVTNMAVKILGDTEGCATACPFADS